MEKMLRMGLRINVQTIFYNITKQTNPFAFTKIVDCITFLQENLSKKPEQPRKIWIGKKLEHNAKIIFLKVSRHFLFSKHAKCKPLNIHKKSERKKEIDFCILSCMHCLVYKDYALRYVNWSNFKRIVQSM